MAKLKIFICAIIVSLISCTNESSQKKCMFISATPGDENAEYEQYIIPQLKAWGYVVDKHSAKNLLNYTETDYAPYDFIFLSETTNSADMAPLRDISKPMLNSDGWGAKSQLIGLLLGGSGRNFGAS